MLLLPLTLTALSVALGTAQVPLAEPQPDPGGLPAATLVADAGYLPDIAGIPELPSDAELPGFGPAADSASLDGMRGGDGTSSSSIVMNGTVADNRATNVVTGTNMITEGSFANASGVPMVVQNTGANVLIQNATVINLQLR
ncbi:hypothetical protein [Pseudoduganella sp. GCM10020061]|uniref:hypothetical protein n=1 Tax=Pseudoduganella sp. GCM10020061 TaxID=3317345 RepID=UPI00362ADB99